MLTARRMREREALAQAALLASQQEAAKNAAPAPAPEPLETSEEQPPAPAPEAKGGKPKAR